MDISDAIQGRRNGVLISLFVNPNSEESLFPAGYNKWRKAVEIKVSSPAEDGKANKEVVEVVSNFFSKSGKKVEIFSGVKSKRKKVFIEDISVSYAVEKVMESIK